MKLYGGVQEAQLEREWVSGMGQLDMMRCSNNLCKITEDDLASVKPDS